MIIEVNYSGLEKEFETIEEAEKFADTLEHGYDIWVNNKLHQTKIKNFKTGKVEITNWHLNSMDN